MGRLAGVPNKKPLDQRFWERVDVRGPDDCWPWVGGRGFGGYGRLRQPGCVGDTRLLTHRLAYHLANPEWPLDSPLDVCHTCDNPPCCNPAHLWLGTQRDNMIDMRDKGRGARGDKIHTVKLTSSQVIEIYNRKGEESHRVTAREFGVGHRTVGRIQRRERWAHLTSQFQSP